MEPRYCYVFLCSVSNFSRSIFSCLQSLITELLWWQGIIRTGIIRGWLFINSYWSILQNANVLYQVPVLKYPNAQAYQFISCSQGCGTQFQKMCCDYCLIGFCIGMGQKINCTCLFYTYFIYKSIFSALVVMALILFQTSHGQRWRGHVNYNSTCMGK